MALTVRNIRSAISRLVCPCAASEATRDSASLSPVSRIPASEAGSGAVVRLAEVARPAAVGRSTGIPHSSARSRAARAVLRALTQVAGLLLGLAEVAEGTRQLDPGPRTGAAVVPRTAGVGSAPRPPGRCRAPATRRPGSAGRSVGAGPALPGPPSRPAAGGPSAAAPAPIRSRQGTSGAWSSRHEVISCPHNWKSARAALGAARGEGVHAPGVQVVQAERGLEQRRRHWRTQAGRRLVPLLEAGQRPQPDGQRRADDDTPPLRGQPVERRLGEFTAPGAGRRVGPPRWRRRR